MVRDQQRRLGGGSGPIYFVTNLDDNQATTGSLKWAMNQPSPKRIIPMISGRISYSSQYKDDRSGGNPEASNWTYYGHLAPEGGLEIYTGGMYYEYVRNIIVRGIKARGRVGDGDNLCFSRGENIIIDHTSTSYSDGGESIDVSGSANTPYKNGDITVQNNLISQSKCGLIMGANGAINSAGNSSYGNIFVNVGWRFPKAGGEIHLESINNGVHNWTIRMMMMEGWAYTVNLIGNFWQKGSNTKNRDNDNLNKTYPVEAAPWPQIYNNDNAYSELPPPGFSPTSQEIAWQYVDMDNPIGFSKEVPSAEYFSASPNINPWRQWPTMPHDSVKTFILDRAGATYYVDDLGVRGRYYDDTELATYNKFKNNTQEDNTSYTYVNSNIPENTRGASYDSNNNGLPDWFEVAHSVSTTDEVKNIYEFTHFSTGVPYVVINNAGYGALDIFSNWVMQDFEFLLDIGEVDGDNTYSINSHSVDPEPETPTNNKKGKKSAATNILNW